MHKIYECSAVALALTSSEKISLRAALFSLQDVAGKHFRTIYALAVETFKSKKTLDSIIDSIRDFEYNVNRLEQLEITTMDVSEIPSFSHDIWKQWVLRVSIYDLCLSPNHFIIRPPTVCPLYTLLIGKKEEINENFRCMPKLSGDLGTKNKLLRYARINPLLITPKKAIDAFKQSGFSFVESTEQVITVTDSSDAKATKLFCKDDIIKNLLCFSAGTDLHNHHLISSGRVILQDKGSCMAAPGLDPEHNWVVLDACSAPGNKTTHLAAILREKQRRLKSKVQPQILAIEKDPRRFKLLKSRIRQLGAVKFISPVLSDFLSLDATKDPRLKQVRAILLDPSCSGSGLINRPEVQDLSEEEDDSKESKRLNSLSTFQARILMHALSFPFVERVSYSTCSVNREENEDVVKNVIREINSTERGENSNPWKLRVVFPEWKRRGLDNVFQESCKCLRTDPEYDRTNGFFLAVFERNPILTDPVLIDSQVKEKKQEKVASQPSRFGEKKRKNNRAFAQQKKANSTVCGWKRPLV